ncbi:hypothetical protein MPC4_400014 [Methylocella tundrae]|uniref:Uncharacterized protein n=1 Tax=Methylocella tundrae TaxID=227605 RepID=A0A8B6M9B6_METTU|nr:hypothetical protein MPC4_400014 [Methylocella tundrae]
MPDLAAMRPTAFLAPAFRSLKPDHRRELRPVDGIEPFVLGADRHLALNLRAKGLERPRRKSRNRAVRNVVGARNLTHRLALVAALDRLALLVICELWPAPHLHAPRFCALAAFARSGADQFALELGKPAQNREHQTSVRGRRVGPCVIEGTKARALAGDCRQRVQEVARRARQPVEARHGQNVAPGNLADDAAQLGAVSFRAARRFPEDLLGSGGAQLLDLRVEALAVRRYPCIAINHRPLMHLIYATKKPL